MIECSKEAGRYVKVKALVGETRDPDARGEIIGPKS